MKCEECFDLAGTSWKKLLTYFRNRIKLSNSQNKGMEITKWLSNVISESLSLSLKHLPLTLTAIDAAIGVDLNFFDFNFFSFEIHVHVKI